MFTKFVDFLENFNACLLADATLRLTCEASGYDSMVTCKIRPTRYNCRSPIIYSSTESIQSTVNEKPSAFLN